MPAEEQQVHRDAGRVGGLHQRDALGGDARDGIGRQTAREHVEAVEDHADPRVPGALDRLPGLAVVVDVAAPGERLEADAEVELGGELAELVQVGGDAVHVAAAPRARCCCRPAATARRAGP